MEKIVLSDQVPFETVVWELTMNLVGPHSTGAAHLPGAGEEEARTWIS